MKKGFQTNLASSNRFAALTDLSDIYYKYPKQVAPQQPSAPRTISSSQPNDRQRHPAKKPETSKHNTRILNDIQRQVTNKNDTDLPQQNNHKIQ